MVKSTSSENTYLHDFSLYLRAEKGIAADAQHFGTSLALNILLPLEIRTHEFTSSSHEPPSASIPNGEVGIFPEFKVQMRRNQVLDMAFALRFQNFIPERLSSMLSYDLIHTTQKTARYTFYLNSALTFKGGLYTALGTEYILSPTSSIFLEYSQWITRFTYKEGFLPTAPRAHPFSVGLAFVVTLPQRAAQK